MTLWVLHSGRLLWDQPHPKKKQQLEAQKNPALMKKVRHFPPMRAALDRPTLVRKQSVPLRT
jgi:hypothetical protein